MMNIDWMAVWNITRIILEIAGGIFIFIIVIYALSEAAGNRRDKKQRAEARTFDRLTECITQKVMAKVQQQLSQESNMMSQQIQSYVDKTMHTWNKKNAEKFCLIRQAIAMAVLDPKEAKKMWEEIAEMEKNKDEMMIGVDPASNGGDTAVISINVGDLLKDLLSKKGDDADKGSKESTKKAEKGKKK